MSATKICPACHKATEAAGKFCRHCGHHFGRPAEQAATVGQQPGPTWQAVVGELPPAQMAKQPNLAQLLKAIPGRIFAQLLWRLPAVLLTFLFSWVLHTYWLVVSNEGFNGSDHWTSPYINIPRNGVLTSLIAFGLTSGLGWSVLTSLLRSGPTATLASLIGAPGRCLQALFRQDPQTRLGVAVGLALALLGSNFLQLSSQARMVIGGCSLFLLMGYPGMLLGIVFGELLSALKVRYPWLRSLEVGLMVRGLLASLPVGFLFSWLFSGGFSEKLGWLALAFVAYTLYKLYNGGKSGPAANLCLVLGMGWLLQYLLAGHCWADDGGWVEATQSTGEPGLTLNNIKAWWNATGSGKSIAQGLGPAMAAAAAAALAPTLTDTGKLDPNRVIGHILQLSANQFSLQPKEAVALTVTVWQVAASGAVSLASGASINLTAPGGVPGLQVQPTTGSGEMACSIVWSGETPAPASATLPVLASAGGSNHSAAVHLQLASAVIEQEFVNGKCAIKPDGKDSTILRARVAQGGTPNPEATASLQFLKGSDWLDTSESVMDGTWKAITVMASDPAGPEARHQAPSPVSLRLTAQLGDAELNGSAQLQLLPSAELDVDLRPDVITLIQGDAKPIKFHAILTNPGTEKWDWRLALDKPEFCSVEYQESETPGVIDVTVVAPTACTEGSSGAQDSTKLHIFAEQTGVEPLERILPVRLAREGITVLGRGRDAEGQHVVPCDTTTKKEFDVVVYVKDENGQLVTNPSLASNLWFEDNCQEQRLRNLLSVAKPEIKPDKPTAADSDVKGYTWTVRSQAYIPGEEGETFRVPMVARVMGHEDKPEFSCQFDLGLKSIPPDIGSEDWRREKEGCKLAIRFVPEPAKSKLSEAIDRWAQTLGHEGLKVFRKKIWRVAQDLILAEGAEGYEDEARWADRCLFLAENVKWGTDLVFTAAAGAAFGPVGVIGAPILKSLIENILVVGSERGFDQVDDWFWESVTELEQTLDWGTVMQQGALVAGGMVTDPAVLEKILGNSPKQKAAGWAIYVGYTFASNMARGMSMCDAIKQTMRTVRDRIVVQFLMGRMKWNFQMPQAIKDAAGRMTGNPPRMTEADMLTIQSDPQLLRSLKTAPGNIQQGFLRTYNSTLVAPHDAQLISHVRGLPGYEGRVVRVETFSTPGKSGGGVGADRDFRVTVQNPDGTWREVPARLWKDQSACILGQLSGGRTPQQLNWRATDRFDIEASPDYATQNGQISNVTKVIRGQATLKDPGQFGNMWQQKMSGVEPGHTVPPLENVAQAQKALGALKAVRSGYQKQGFKVGALTPQMEKGAQIVQGANVTATGDYHAVNSALQKAGFKGGFPEFANKVAGQFQALGMARK